jgi:hypothetical protein
VYGYDPREALLFTKFAIFTVKEYEAFFIEACALCTNPANPTTGI